MNKITIENLNTLKAKKEKITSLTAYDASFAQIIDQAGVEVILVGDSLGTIIQGNKTTVSTTVNDMIYHTQAVSRVVENALVIIDLPFLSYSSKQKAFKTVSKIFRNTQAHMVKLEGVQTKIIKALSKQGVAVCAHLGLLPQSINHYGKYQAQGTNPDTAKKLLNEAIAVQNAGAKLLVLECVPSQLARQISQELTIPTIGIGAGVDCDGQVLVLYDLLGISLNKTPKFAKNYLQSADSVQEAIKQYIQEVKTKTFPTSEHSF